MCRPSFQTLRAYRVALNVVHVVGSRPIGLNMGGRQSGRETTVHVDDSAFKELRRIERAVEHRIKRIFGGRSTTCQLRLRMTRRKQGASLWKHIEKRVSAINLPHERLSRAARAALHAMN